MTQFKKTMKTDNYGEMLRDTRWQQLRTVKLTEANWRCEKCGDSKEILNVHHTYYARDEHGTLRPPWHSAKKDLQVLCETCHKLTHMDQSKIKAFAGVRFAETKLPLRDPESFPKRLLRILEDKVCSDELKQIALECSVIYKNHTRELESQFKAKEDVIIKRTLREKGLIP